MHGKIYDNIMQTMGNTPLVRFPRITDGVPADLCYKLEFFNPIASVKDRIGIAMIEALEAEGKLQPGGTIVEPTSGNTGIGIAFAAAAKGYKAILVMPEQMSIERRKMMKLLGAELVLTEAAGGIPGAMAKADEICAATPGAVQAGQFVNPANPAIHYKTTGPEIWNDTGGQVDAFDIIDDVVTIDNDAAFGTAKHVAAEDGVPVGISSGAAIAASLIVGARPNMRGKRIVTIIPSFAERYLSTPLFD